VALLLAGHQDDGHSSIGGEQLRKARASAAASMLLADHYEMAIQFTTLLVCARNRQLFAANV
jgi:hypothetical protein